MQLYADNIDRTIDGKGTFHDMGFVCCTTGGNQNSSMTRSHKIKRQTQKLAEDVIKSKGIPASSYYSEGESGLSKLEFKPRIQQMMPISPPVDTSLDFLWHTALFLKNKCDQVGRGSCPTVVNTPVSLQSHSYRFLTSILITCPLFIQPFCLW